MKYSTMVDMPQNPTQLNQTKSHVLKSGDTKRVNMSLFKSRKQ